jgi:predicted ATP-dependent Lon-type protease
MQHKLRFADKGSHLELRTPPHELRHPVRVAQLPAARQSLPVVVALCGGLLGRNTRGGTIVVGAFNLGGSIEMIPNAARIAELAIDKQAQTLLMPGSQQLNDLADDLWTKISIEFYKDGADAVFKALMEQEPDGLATYNGRQTGGLQIATG